MKGSQLGLLIRLIFIYNLVLLHKTKREWGRVERTEATNKGLCISKYLTNRYIWCPIITNSTYEQACCRHESDHLADSLLYTKKATQHTNAASTVATVTELVLGANEESSAFFSSASDWVVPHTSRIL